MSELTTQKGTEETVREYFDAIEARDLDRMAAVWHPDGTDYFYGLTTLDGPDGVRHWFGELFRSFPDFTLKLTDIVTEGDRSTVRWRATGTFDGDAKFDGLAPTGASIELEGIDMLSVCDGLIFENRAYTNATEMARQLGAMPPAGSIGDKAMLAAVNAASASKRLLKRLSSS